MSVWLCVVAATLGSVSGAYKANIQPFKPAAGTRSSPPLRRLACVPVVNGGISTRVRRL